MKRKKFLSLFLSVVVLLGCFPITASSKEAQTTLDTENSVLGNEGLSTYNEYSTQTQEFVSDEIIGNVEEIVSLREESVKHFRLSNGSYEAISFSAAVHRKDKEGAWQDINNNLTLVRDGEKQGYFTDDMRTSFASSFMYGRELFSINENGYEISMTPLSTGKATTETKQSAIYPIVTNAERKTSQTKFDSIESAIQQIDNRVSIVYNDIRENTDIKYVLDGNNVKENIIVKAKTDSYEYAFQLNLTGLTAELDQGGGVLIRDAKTEEEKYTIPAPFMYDGNNEYSYDVHYELNSVAKGKYTLKVIASEEWISSEDRKFPVTIDPTIQGTIWVDTYIDSQNPSVSYASSDVLYAGQTRIALIKPNIPSLPLNIISIDSAELYFSYYNVNESFVVGVHDVVGMIDANTTYNNRPSIVSNKTAQKAVKANFEATASSPKTVSVPITPLFRNWFYSAAIAYGVAIKYYSGSETGIVSIASAETSHAPYLRVGYTQQIPDGVYAIKNVNSLTWMTVENGSEVAGSFVCHKVDEVSPTSSFDRSSLFKISGSDGLYIIRLMTNNSLTLDASGVELRTKEIPSKDEDVLDEDKFSIVRNGTSFYIIPYNTDKAIFTLGFQGDPLCVLPIGEGDDARKWTFEQYTGSHQGGASLISSSSWESKGIVDETSGSATIRVWSTYTDVHAFEMQIHPGYEDLGEVSWNNVGNVITISATNPGEILIDCMVKSSINEVLGIVEFSFIIVPQEGLYRIRNVDTRKYVDIDAGSSQVGAIIHQWHYHTEDQINWIVEHVEGEGGYIRLKSARSNLYLGVDPANTSDIRQYASNDYTLWMIDRTDTGNITLTNKATSGTDKVLAVPLNEDLNGTNLTQISYTDNDNYRDEWGLYEHDAHIINLEVIYDQAYVSRYPNASIMIDEQVQALQEKFLNEFGMIIDFYSLSSFYSYADQMCPSDYDEPCTCGDESQCSNSTISNNPTLETLHHKNFYNIMARIDLPNTAETLKIAYIGHEMCMIDDETSAHESCTYYGIAFLEIGFAAVMNFDSEKSSTKTLIHEFGHFFGAPDHYNIGDVPSTGELNAETEESAYSSNCIYGENKEDAGVLDNLTICDGCRAEIQKNIDRYNH